MFLPDNIKDLKVSKERLFIKVICQYKKNQEHLARTKIQIQKEINIILRDFTKKTGKEIKAIKIEKEDNKFKVTLEILE